MNKHQNIVARETRIAKALNWGQKFKSAHQDHMPREVATSLLCAGGTRSSNRERKTWNAAREINFVAKQTAIPEEEKVSVRLQSKSWQQLHKQLARIVEARKKAQRHFVFLQRQSLKLDSRNPEHGPILALLQRQLAALDLHAAGLDSLRDAVESETDRRFKFCAQLRELSPEIAKRLRRKLCGYAARN